MDRRVPKQLEEESMKGMTPAGGWTSVMGLVAVMVLVAGCHQGGKTSVPCGCTLADIVGAWEWTLTTGGVAGIYVTPESSGEHWTCCFREDGTYEQDRSGEAYEQGRYAIEFREGADHLQHPALVISGDPDRLIERPDAGTLILRDNVIDGFEHTFSCAASRR